MLTLKDSIIQPAEHYSSWGIQGKCAKFSSQDCKGSCLHWPAKTPLRLAGFMHGHWGFDCYGINTPAFDYRHCMQLSRSWTNCSFAGDYLCQISRFVTSLRTRIRRQFALTRMLLLSPSHTSLWFCTWSECGTSFLANGYLVAEPGNLSNQKCLDSIQRQLLATRVEIWICGGPSMVVFLSRSWINFTTSWCTLSEACDQNWERSSLWSQNSEAAEIGWPPDNLHVFWLLSGMNLRPSHESSAWLVCMT